MTTAEIQSLDRFISAFHNGNMSDEYLFNLLYLLLFYVELEKVTEKTNLTNNILNIDGVFFAKYTPKNPNHDPKKQKTSSTGN